jgi:predicted DNA-binding transcriptional regulator
MPDEFGVENVSVPFCNAALLIVSAAGFCMLAITVYSILVVRLKTADEIEDRTYDDTLKRADIASLNRAERRARAKAIMKEQRRVEFAAAANDEQQQEDTIHIPAQTRKERQKAAKATEKHERKLCEEQRAEQQRQAREQALAKRLAREQEQASRVHDEQKSKRAEKEARELEDVKERTVFFSTSACSETIQAFQDEAMQSRAIRIADISERFQVTDDAVLERIHALVKRGQLTGVIDQGHFISFSHEELQEVAVAIAKKGEASMEDIINLCKPILLKESC